MLAAATKDMSYGITRQAMNWFRVARESMLRDGVEQGYPPARRIWELLPCAAQQAWRDVVRTVTPTEEQLAVLIPALDALLARRDFYREEAFGSVELPPDAEEMRQRHELLHGEALIRFNRSVFQNALECVESFKFALVVQAGALLMPWLRNGDPRTITLATAAVRAAEAQVIFNAQFHLHEGMASAALAKAYDAFAPYLSADHRAAWERLLVRLLELYLATARRRHWCTCTLANANPVGNAGAGLLAMALWREQPALAHEALDYARKYVWSWLDYCQGADGGNTEGAQYWQYALEHFLPFAQALERVFGSDDGLLSHPSVINAMNMIRLGLCNDGALHGVNDTVPMPLGGTVAWFLAGRSGDPFACWYGVHTERIYAGMRAQGREITYDGSPWFRLFSVRSCRSTPRSRRCRRRSCWKAFSMPPCAPARIGIASWMPG